MLLSCPAAAREANPAGMSSGEPRPSPWAACSFRCLFLFSLLNGSASSILLRRTNGEDSAPKLDVVIRSLPSDSRMEEGRKRVLAIVAGILVARHLKNTEDLRDSRPSPRTESLIGSAVQWAERIMRRIDGTFADSNDDRRGHRT